MGLHDYEINQIISSLPSFYVDNGYSPEVLTSIYSAMFGVMDNLTALVDNSRNSSLMSNSNMYRTLPIMVVPAKSGLYDVNKAASRFSSDGYGNWFDSSDADLLRKKVNFLDKYGVYEPLSSRSDWETIGSPVINADVARSYTSDLPNYTNFTDYVIKDSKLYLFGDLAKPSQTTYGKDIILKNVKLGQNPASSPAMSTMLNLPVSPYLTLEENAALFQSLVKAIAGGPTISNLNSALAILYKDGNLKVEDQYSAPPKDQGMWVGTSTNPPILNPFDFIIKIPQSYSLFTDTLDLITNYIGIVKPTYTNYMIIWSLGTSDSFSLVETPSVNLPVLRWTESGQVLFTDSMAIGTLKYTSTETFTPTETNKVINIYRTSDTLVSSDSQVAMTRIMPLGTDVLLDALDTFDSGLLFDNDVSADPNYDTAMVQLTTSPEMPVTCNVTKGANNLITLVFNNTGVDSYEILRDNTTSITVSGQVSGSSVTVQDNKDNSLPLGTHTYMIRSWQGGVSSQWTLTYSITL